MKTDKLLQLINLRVNVKDIKKKADNGVNDDISNIRTLQPEFDFKSYSWDQCISDNKEKYGEKGAAKVCGAIKNMAEQEMSVPDRIDGEEFIIPKPTNGENKESYISRCMKSIGKEYDTPQQALAVCYSQLEHK
jgi:hypothetical protein